MNILCSVNERLLRQLKCMLYSLAESQSEPMDIFFVNLTLTDYQLNNLKKYVEALQMTFHEIKPSADLVSKVQKARCEQLEILNRTFSMECYVRVFAHLLLPKEMTRILWIDADCIVQKDISKLYNYNLFDSIGFATIDCYELDGSQHDYVTNSIKAPMGLSEQDTMFNSGVLLLNLRRMRELEKFAEEELLKLLKDKPELHFDQDILNYLCKNEIIINRDLIFNYPPNWSSYDDIMNNMSRECVLHYYGVHKPWLETSNTPVAGIQPWKRYDKMSRILDNLIGTKYI